MQVFQLLRNHLICPVFTGQEAMTASSIHQKTMEKTGKISLHLNFRNCCLFSVLKLPYDPKNIFLSSTSYKLNDYRPLIFKSTDGGQNWSRINGDCPKTEILRVICEDTTCPGLLFVGSKNKISMSDNFGKKWFKLGGNFPVVPVYDLKIKQNDLVVGTHRRSFWILDDLTPLRKFDRKS